jgi:hypothetical protein
MKHASILSLACSAALGVIACGTGPLAAIERSSSDPAIVAPRVVSFAAENRISVSWPADPCADEYVLEEASGSVSSPTYSVVYRGTASGYEERDCADRSLHLYRLTKMRGNREFGPSDAVLGVGSAVIEDAHEPNDAETQATNFGYGEYDVYGSANLYCYRSYDGIEVEDEDWYAIVVSPRTNAYIVVVQTDPEIVDKEATWMLFCRRGESATPVINDEPIALTNYSNSPRRISFKLYPQAEDFYGSGGAAGGSMVNYTVKLYGTMSL